jgi:ribonuclease-3
MSRSELQAAAERLGIRLRDPSLLERALTHKTFAHEAPATDEVRHNERLEFLGDAVLGLVSSELLMEAFPTAQEGELSQMRACLVNQEELAALAGQLGLHGLLRLGRGEERSGGRQKQSLQADALEALLGALFLDQGLAGAQALVNDLMRARIERLRVERPWPSPKSRLQEMLQARGEPPPTYELVTSDGPVHARVFTVAAMQAGAELGRGTGRSKKAAAQAAAQDALRRAAGQESP